MVTLLQDSELDLEAESLDGVLDAPVPVDDLRASSRRNGGTGGNRVTKGRGVARQAWRYDGTPSVIAVAWNPEGTRHDGGREYLKKKACRCCGDAGFKMATCPKCIRNNCTQCNVGRDKTKVIRLYYLRYDDVPYPKEVKTGVDCFLSTCIRKGVWGFPTLEAMLLHGRWKHRGEYASYREAEQMRKSTESDDLKKRVDELTSLLMNQRQAPSQLEPVAERPSRRWTPERRKAASLAAKARIAAGETR